MFVVFCHQSLRPVGQKVLLSNLHIARAFACAEQQPITSVVAHISLSVSRKNNHRGSDTLGPNAQTNLLPLARRANGYCEEHVETFTTQHVNTCEGTCQ